MRVVFEDTETGCTVHADIAPNELKRLSGVQLAAALFPDPTTTEVTTINEFLTRYQAGAP